MRAVATGVDDAFEAVATHRVRAGQELGRVFLSVIVAQTRAACEEAESENTVSNRKKEGELCTVFGLCLKRQLHSADMMWTFGAGPTLLASGKLMKFVENPHD